MSNHYPFSFAFVLATLVASLSLSQVANAAVFTYQGQLVESGAPATGPVDLAFRLYDAANGGGQIGSEQTFANFSDFAAGGEFTVELDFGAGAFPGAARWLEIRVGGQALSPRLPVRATPYAMHADSVRDGALPAPYGTEVDFSNTGNAFAGDGSELLNIDWDSLVNVPPGFADGVDNASDIWNTNGNDVYYDAGNVGIGTSSTNSMLTVGAGDGANFQVGQAPQLYMAKDNVDDKFRIQLAGSGYTGYQLQIGRDDGGHEVLLKGDVGIGTNNPTYPLHVVSNSTAIKGEGDIAGIWGKSDSTDGKGVFGEATATTSPSFGVYGQSSTMNGQGVHGTATEGAGGGTGVFGESFAGNGSGVSGFAWNTVGTNQGVFARSESINGRGIYAYAAAKSGLTYGVLGKSDSPDGYGVYSQGELGASGAKSFVIDHPFDPENKYLKHYSSEGPEPLNVYRGRVTLDGSGEAWVALPDYFEAINRDPLYTLTPIGAAMPNLHVAEEVLNNEFRISGGEPGMDVSWRVEAVRDDVYIRARGAPVEVEKGEHERGLYQHPELYDQPPEKGINYAATVIAEN